jgi:hypothetical protein
MLAGEPLYRGERTRPTSSWGSSMCSAPLTAGNPRLFPEKRLSRDGLEVLVLNGLLSRDPAKCLPAAAALP